MNVMFFQLFNILSGLFVLLCLFCDLMVCNFQVFFSDMVFTWLVVFFLVFWLVLWQKIDCSLGWGILFTVVGLVVGVGVYWWFFTSTCLIKLCGLLFVQVILVFLFYEIRNPWVFLIVFLSICSLWFFGKFVIFWYLIIFVVKVCQYIWMGVCFVVGCVFNFFIFLFGKSGCLYVLSLLDKDLEAGFSIIVFPSYKTVFGFMSCMVGWSAMVSGLMVYFFRWGLSGLCTTKAYMGVLVLCVWFGGLFFVLSYFFILNLGFFFIVMLYMFINNFFISGFITRYHSGGKVLALVVSFFIFLCCVSYQCVNSTEISCIIIIVFSMVRWIVVTVCIFFIVPMVYLIQNCRVRNFGACLSVTPPFMKRSEVVPSVSPSSSDSSSNVSIFVSSSGEGYDPDFEDIYFDTNVHGGEASATTQGQRLTELFIEIPVDKVSKKAPPMYMVFPQLNSPYMDVKKQLMYEYVFTREEFPRAMACSERECFNVMCVDDPNLPLDHLIFPQGCYANFYPQAAQEGAGSGAGCSGAIFKGCLKTDLMQEVVRNSPGGLVGVRSNCPVRCELGMEEGVVEVSSWGGSVCHVIRDFFCSTIPSSCTSCWEWVGALCGG